MTIVFVSGGNHVGSWNHVSGGNHKIMVAVSLKSYNRGGFFSAGMGMAFESP
jgi:hypothetical protein